VQSRQDRGAEIDRTKGGRCGAVCGLSGERWYVPCLCRCVCVYMGFFFRGVATLEREKEVVGIDRREEEKRVNCELIKDRRVEEDEVGRGRGE
jgi:hypothetical protein